VLAPELSAPSVYDVHGNFAGDEWNDPVFRRSQDAAYADRMAACLPQAPRGIEGAQLAAEWAVGADLTPRLDELAAALDCHEVFFEELFDRLLAGLGLICSPVGISWH
jgi:hypothetical protein